MVPEYICVNTEKKFTAMAADVAEYEHAAIDTETNSLNVYTGDFKIAGICVAVEEARGYYIPIGHELPAGLDLLAACNPIRQTDPELVLTWLQDVLNTKRHIWHNYIYDCQVLERFGLTVPDCHFDTLLAASLLRDASGKIGLKYLAEKVTGRAQMTIEELTGSKPERLLYMPPEEVTPYAAADAVNTLILYRHLSKKLKETTPEIRKLFWEVEMPLSRVVVEMEKRGIVLNVEEINKIKARLVQDMDRAQKAAEECLVGSPSRFAGELITREAGLNLRSGPDMLRLVFGEMSYVIPRNQRKELLYRLDARTIKKLRRVRPRKDSWKERGPAFLKALSEYKKASKVLTTYTDSLIGFVTPDGRIHTHVNPTGTLSGRAASARPNLTNLVKDTEKWDIRHAFVADKGYVFVLGDYSTAEMVVLAAISQDEEMLRIINDPALDIHTYTASIAYGVAYKEVTPTQRQNAKAINFGIAYGRGPWDVADELGISVVEAERLIRMFFQTFPKVKPLFRRVREYMRHHGWGITHYGRRRVLFNGTVPSQRGLSELWNISPNEAKAKIASWERQAINLICQGGVADAIKIAMIDVHNKLPEIDDRARIVLQVHDEIIVLCRKEYAEEVKTMVIRTMPQDVRGMRLAVDATIQRTLTKDKTKAA